VQADHVVMAANNLIVFPTSPARAGLAKDPTMAEHLTRDQVTTDVLLEKLTLAGFEAKMEDEDLYIEGTGCSTRVDIHPDMGIVRIRALYMLNCNVNDQTAEAFCSQLNKRLFVTKFVNHRWEDGDLGLFMSHTIQFNFGLNLPNFLFALRRFIESCQSLYRTDIMDTRFDPNFKPAELELVAEANIQETG
jgi:hypothetical protein